MNTKYIAIILAVIIIVAAVIGAYAYSTYSSTSSLSPTPTPTPSPTPTISPSPTATATSSPTTSPVITASPTPSPTASPTPVPTYSSTSLTIFAASSLAKVITNMSSAFKDQYNCNIIVSSGSSSTLEQQIVAGSPCDVFMSADTKWTTVLKNSNLLLNNNATSFTTNKLCVILAPGNPKGIASLADLVNPGVRLVVAAPTVPVGSYTNTTLWKIDSTWGNSSSPQYVSSGAYVNFNSTFASNVKSYETSDENVVGDIGLNTGAYDAGMVFVSDWAYANITGLGVQFMAIDPSVNTVGNYGIAVIGGTSNANMAQIFMNYWSTTEGQNLLKEFGFGQ